MNEPASVALDEARSLLDDTAGNVWNDTALLPKLQQAHRELQIQLRAAAAPITRTTVESPVAAGATVLTTPPTDMIEPIKIWERAPSDPVSAYILMTECDPLPILPQDPTYLNWWKWTLQAIEFLGCIATRTVKIYYKRQIPIPAVGTDLIGFIDGENFVGPRTASLAYASTGNSSAAAWCDGIANMNLADVLIANRGRTKAAQRS